MAVRATIGVTKSDTYLNHLVLMREISAGGGAMVSELTFGAWLRRRRRALDLTREEVAQHVSCSVSAVRRMEADELRPSKQLAEGLAATLGIAPSDRSTFVRFARDTPGADTMRLPIPMVSQDHPAPPARVRTNLLIPPTALIGREREVASVGALLRRADVRLLTLTGPGGIGKTRLGLQVAADLVDDFTDGVYFVDLAPVRAPTLVISAIAQTLGVREIGGQPLVTQLKQFLSDQRMLLLLDNFEHVLDAAPLLADLLATAARVKLLVTSRARLHLRGEQQFPVPPLRLPDLAQLPDVGTLTQYAAVALFVARAQAIQPAFHLTSANAPDVAAICARLDGLPLAIELAAARSKLFAPEALLARLEHRLALLTGGVRDLPARQQTLRNTIAWSYDLLTAAQQRLFRCLSVFVGGCTIEAAIAVYDTTVDPNADVLEGLTALLDQNLLLQKEGADGEPRFTMLETIREYAIEQLAASGEAEALQLQHATYFLALAKTATPELTGPQQQMWLDRLDQEHDNLRAALTWSQSVGDAALGLRLAEALWPFWRARGYWSEGRDWLAGLLALTQHGDVSSSLRAKALNGAGMLASCQGDFIQTVALCRESLALFDALGDKRGIALSLNELGSVAYNHGDHEQATACCQKSLTLFRELGDKQGIAEALGNLGRMARDQGDNVQATTLFQESLTLFRELGNKRGVALALISVGNMAFGQGDYATARSLHEESLTLFRELGDNWGAALSLNHLGMVAREQGGYVVARSLHEESLALRRALGNKTGIAASLADLGQIAHRQGDDARAASLFDDSLTRFRELENKAGIAWLLCLVGEMIHCQGDNVRAATLLEESLALSRELENKRDIPWALGNLARVVHAQGDDGRATALFEECLELSRERGDKPGIAGCLEGLAGIAAMHCQPIRATRLFAAGVRLRETIGGQLHRQPIDRADYDRHLAAVRVQLDDATFAAAWAAGQALTLEQAMAEALAASQIGNEASA